MAGGFSHHPSRPQEVSTPDAILEKLTYGIVAVALFLAGRLAEGLLPAALLI
jgi:hypothetical protein